MKLKLFAHRVRHVVTLIVLLSFFLIDHTLNSVKSGFLLPPLAWAQDEVLGNKQEERDKNSSHDRPHEAESLETGPLEAGPPSAPAADLPAMVVYGSPLGTTFDTPTGSITIVSQEQIQDKGLDNIQHQILSLPNVHFAGGSNRPRFFQIRGIGELEQYEGAPNSSVAVIVDDVDLTGSSAALSLFDTSQLEIHRGPQPVRFGSSALAGAVNLATVAPPEYFSGRFFATGGNDYLKQSGLLIGGPLNERAGAQLSLFGHLQDGFRENVFLGRDDTNKREELAARAKVQLQVADESQVEIALTNINYNNNYDAFSIFNGLETQSDKPGRDVERLKVASIRGIFSLSQETELISVTSYYRSDNRYSFDGDWGNNPFWTPYDPYDYFSDSSRDRRAFAQQFRINDSWNLMGREARTMVGAYFQELLEKTAIEEYFEDFVYDSLSSDYRSNTYAAFAGVELPLSDETRIIPGVRLEQRDSRYEDSRLSSFTPKDLMWGGSVTLAHDVTPSTSIFQTVSRGFRGGGFNVSTGIPEHRKEYSPESLINLELGSRLFLLENSLRGSLVAFASLRQDQQIKLAEQNDPSDPLSFTYITDNAAKGRSFGLESEIEYDLTPRVLIASSGSLLHTEITSADEQLGLLKGREQSHAPRWQYALEGRYFFSEPFSATLGVSGKGRFYFDDSHNQRSNPYHLVHSSIQYDSADWRLQLWVRNLTDKRYPVRGFFFGNEPPDFPEKLYLQLGDPRSFGVTWSYFF